MYGSDVSHVVVPVDHKRHMVSEARGEERQEKNKKPAEPSKFHKHIQLHATLPNSLRAKANLESRPASKNIVKSGPRYPESKHAWVAESHEPLKFKIDNYLPRRTIRPAWR